MSFQGDVGGIGLADLLQSLARGREGVLTLIGKGGARSSLGVQGGQLHLLPEPEEDPEVWRNRARQAWIKDPDFRIDSLRMTEIARAQRIEDLYRLLDSQGVHFRFTPGPLPARPTEAAISASEPGVERKGPRRDAVFCQPFAVEGLLLEYARLQDEVQSAGPHAFASDHVVLCQLEGSGANEQLGRFHAEVDGASNLIEIGDRLAWPLRQVYLVAHGEIARGTLRLAQPYELLTLVQSELIQGNFGRAASRLRAWCDSASPGPVQPDEAQFFSDEWIAGRLQNALRGLPPRTARALMRRIDLGQGNPLTATEHWTELVHITREDSIAGFHLMQCQVRSNADPNVPSMRDLLALARSFGSAGQRMRAAAVLRVAALRGPDTTLTRLEVGLGLIGAGAAREGAPWIIEAATAMMKEGEADKALAPLRTLIDADTTNREARRLLARARTQHVQRALTKKNSLVTAAVVLALSIGAWVQIRSRGDFDEKLRLVTANMSDPREALRVLEETFAGDSSTRVAELRASLLERQKADDSQSRTDWTDRYHDAAVECTVGDPLLGLKRTLELPPPPPVRAGDDPWPLVSDLFNGVCARLENDVSKFGGKVGDDNEQVHAEQRVGNLVADLRAVLAGAKETKDVRDFGARLSDFEKRLAQRKEQRAEARATRLKQEDLQRQDLMLGTARAHAQAGDHERALDVYKQLIATDASGKLKDLLAKEMRAVGDKSKAIAKARELAAAGKHDEARRTLTSSTTDLRSVLLPWRVETFPRGGRARLKDGTVRVAPFVVESAFGEPVEMSLELDGNEPLTLSVDQPGDHLLYFSRNCERWWKSAGRVDALPVAVGDDHVVCDRSGTVARLSKDKQPVWQHKLASLGGIARAPVFLPHKPGSLLSVTEDGEVWVIDAASGAIDGPLSMGQPPLAGPVASERGVRVLFRDGTLAEWDARLKPEILHEETLVSADLASLRSTVEKEAQNGSSAGLCVLRRGSQGGNELLSPWTGWRVEVQAATYLFTPKDAKEPTFSVRRSGDWSFVAWEAPHMLVPRGRVWVADGLGLRSFQP